jgi:hypothetical protein
MNTLFSFNRIIKVPANTSISLVCVLVITMLSTSCASAPTKQTVSTDTAVNSLTAKESSENILKKLECRDVEVTGTRFKRKICEFKETWVAIDKENSEKSDEFVRKMNDQATIVNPQGLPASNTVSNSAVTSPMGQ